MSINAQDTPEAGPPDPEAVWGKLESSTRLGSGNPDSYLRRALNALRARAEAGQPVPTEQLWLAEENVPTSHLAWRILNAFMYCENENKKNGTGAYSDTVTAVALDDIGYHAGEPPAKIEAILSHPSNQGLFQREPSGTGFTRRRPKVNFQISLEDPLRTPYKIATLFDPTTFDGLDDEPDGVRGY